MMDRIIVLVDDAEHAMHTLDSLPPSGESTRWVVIAVPPRLKRHQSRWVSHATRQRQLDRWSAELFECVGAALRHRHAGEVQTLLARKAPVGEDDPLLLSLGPARMLDARKHRSQRADEPMDDTGTGSALAILTSTAGFGALMALAD